MPSETNTPKLDLLRIQETWQFGDAAFNRFIDDADDKLVGVAHLQSPMHWTEWQPETEYAYGDVVRYPALKSHQYAVCLSRLGGTSDVKENIPENNITGSIFMDNTVKWEVRSLTEADANGGTIRIWLGGGVSYARGDAVRYGDALYRAKIDHESSTTFAADEDKWQEIYASIRFWKPNTYYYLDDTAIYDNNIYKCIEAHTSVNVFEGNPSATPPVVGDEDKWELIGGAGGAKDWESDTKYQYGQLVLVHGILYRCNTKHRSSNSFSSDIANWDLVDAQIHDWKAGEYYVAGTIVAYNNVLYKCVTSHTASAGFYMDISNWVLYHNPITIWARNQSYYIGQITIYYGIDESVPIPGGGGTAWLYHDFRLYRCNTTHVSSNQIVEDGVLRDATFLDDIANWDALNASPAMWRPSTAYKFADIVEFRNELFKCCKAHISNNDNAVGIFADMSDNVSTNCWYRIRIRNAYIENWKADTFYDVNQLVLYNGTLYRCNTTHTSTSTFDATKWDLVYANIQPWTTGIPYKVNSAVLNDGHLYICTTVHTSTTFNSDIANWVEIGGSGAVEDWASGVAYAKDDIVLYSGILYRNNAVHTSALTFANDATYWDIVYASIPTWTTNVYYPVNMIVSYNNLAYKCVSAHTASADFNTDIANWILFNNSITTWSASTMYKAGQVVIHNGLLYKCNANHVSGAVFDPTKFDGFGVDIKHEIPDYPIEQGMNVKVTTDKKLIANDLTKWVRAAGKEEEINKLGVRDLKNKDIFGDWKAYTCNSDGTDWNDETNAEQVAAKNSYSFNTTYDAIICSRNNDAFSAFISQDLYEPDYIVDYTIDNRILAQIDPSLANDDDALFFIAGFMQDANGDYHTLSVIRVGDDTNDHGMRFAIAYDVYTSWLSGVGSTAKVLENNTTLIAHNWDGNSYANLQVEKSTTGIVAKTSQINSDAYAVTLTYTLPVTKPSDMTQEQYDNIKYMLEHDTRIGFGTQSNCSAFKLLNSSGSIKRISVYNTDTIKKVTFESSVKISETDDTKVLLPQELVYSELNKRLYYVKGQKDVKEIQLNTFCTQWVSEGFYVENAIVQYQGAVYRCKECNFDTTFDPAKWEQIGGKIATKAQIDALFI